ncbi:hypothetical protein ABZW67_06215 [Streptomyces rubiginosohelvolus]|uniref:hypothetical protein n=1 Tax=Streptomyces rubiginosohelvolus TaxID=67362 RepID=UPI0033AB6D6A
MSWRYDVFECNNETDDHDKCEVMSGPPLHVNIPWKDAYRRAEELPHAVVESRYMGERPYKRTPHIVFEHIEGGGTCWLCGRGRGPLCKTGHGNKFVCDPCQRDMRRQHEHWAREAGMEPSEFTYVPIIDTLDLGPQ